MTYPSGRVVTITGYDALGRPGAISSGATPYASGVGYASHRAIKSLTLGNGIVETTNWNMSRLQPSSITAGGVSANLYYCASHLLNCTTNNGNLVEQDFVQQGVSYAQTYTYDNLNRILTANENSAANWSQTFGYSSSGNRAVTAWSGAGSVNPVWTPTAVTQFTVKNQFMRDQSAAGADQYDLAGNQISVSSASAPDVAANTMAYDAENRMVSANIAGTGAVNYTYDGDGRRVTKSVPATGATTIYVYNAAGQLAAEYGIGNTAPPSGTFYLTQDHLGSTRVVTNTSGAAVKCYDYMPFGEEVPSGAGGRGTCFGNGLYPAVPDTVSEKFRGKERDAESGLDYFGARYMSSAQGRFTSPDLVNVTNDRLVSPSNTLNKYVNGGNNPLKYTDPDGRDITVFYEPGIPTGHVMLAASNPSNGDFALLSVGPQQHLDPNILSNPNAGVPGTTTFNIPQTVDDLRQNFAALTIQTTPEVAQQAIDAIRNGAGSGNWSLFGNNCTSSCAKVLQDIGLSPGGHGWTAWTPSRLWTNLIRRYGKARNPVANAVMALTPLIQRVPDRGVDYGNPRYGMNTFDFIFRQEQVHPPTKACVTVQGANGPETSCE